MSCYLIAAIDIADVETYKLYEQANIEMAKVPQDLEFLAADENVLLLEGKLPGKRVVMVKFDSEEKLKEWYYGAAYQAAAKIRQKAAHTSFVIGVHGFQM
ncbi:DUF1330 domain-containing protein [Rhizorhabdus argentea]|uniref:DUF1330 domain-containing protein n=1 Tax=Rhizorhabdus argentea TaxID=1387174 RepID=UPI0030ED89F4